MIKGSKHSDESKMKMRKAKIGYKPTNIASFKGHKHNEETKSRIGQASKLRKPMLGKRHTEETKMKIGQAQRGEKSSNFGKHASEETRRKMSEFRQGKHPGNFGKSFDGGYSIKNIPKYDLYAPQISYAERVRRNDGDSNVLEVMCTKCKKWFIPKASAVKERIRALIGKKRGESHLYCNDVCKQTCSIFNKTLYSSDEKRPENRSREVQADLAAMVLERDEYTCIKCGSKEKLECHHIEGIHHEPMESADMDVCVTFCEVCHDAAHKEKGCTYDDMKCKIEDREIFIPILK